MPFSGLHSHCAQVVHRHLHTQNTIKIIFKKRERKGGKPKAKRTPVNS